MNDYQFFVDLWRYFRECSKADWKERISMTERFAYEHECSRMAKDMSLVVLDEMERREKTKEGR